MAVRAQQSNISWCIVSPIPVDMVKLQHNIIGYWMAFGPATFRAFRVLCHKYSFGCVSWDGFAS